MLAQGESGMRKYRVGRADAPHTVYDIRTIRRLTHAAMRCRVFDPYPFAFLLFLSSLSPLIFMFIIMVGQEVLGRAGDKRAQQTYLDAEAVLYEYARLEEHLTAQDWVTVEICGDIAEHAPAARPIRGAIAHR